MAEHSRKAQSATARKREGEDTKRKSLCADSLVYRFRQRHVSGGYEAGFPQSTSAYTCQYNSANAPYLPVSYCYS